MLAEIITIGDEILIGQIVDTNSAWMATELNKIGVRVKQISSVSDDREHILKALAEAANRVDIVFITGGLGPTKDDITKKTLAEYFGVELVEDPDTLEHVKGIFARFNRPLIEVNRLQAYVPANCKVIFNQNGTAPGMWFYENKVTYISMPGVPFEMMYMMTERVLPQIKELFQLPVIIHKTILTVGVGESFLAEQIADIENDLPAHIKLAYLPKLGIVRLRLSTFADHEAGLQEQVDQFAKRIVERIGDAFVIDKDITLEKAVLDKMEARGLTLSVAESCTGGYLSHLFTQHPGSSVVFLGGGVTYAYELKESVLGVKHQTLLDFGAVSEQTVKEMVEGALKNFKSDFAIAITGIAGPDGGTETKPVGTVWIAVAGKQKMLIKKYTFGNKRIQNIERSAIAALSMLNTLLT